MQQQRADHRFAENLTVRIRMANTEPMSLLASVQDLNPDGMSFRSTTAFDPQTRIAFALTLSTGLVHLTGRVMHVEPVQLRHGVVHTHGIRFDPMPMEDRDAIELHCTRHAVPVWRQRYRQSLDVFSRITERLRNARVANRETVQLAANVAVDGHETSAGDAFLEEVSPAGARLLMEQPVAPGSVVRFDVPGTALKGDGRVVSSRALESDIGVRFAVGIRYDNGTATEGQRRSLLAAWFGATRTKTPEKERAA